MARYNEMDIGQRQKLVSVLTPQQIVAEPQLVVKEIMAAAVKPQSNWQIAHDQLPVAYVSRFVEKAMNRNKRIDERRIRVVESVARAVVNRLQFARWNVETTSPRLAAVDEQLGISMLMRSVFMRAEIQAVTYMFVWPAKENSELAMIRVEPDTCIVGYPVDGHSIWPEWGARISKTNPADKNITQLDLYYEDRSTRWRRDETNSDWQVVYADLAYRSGWPNMVPIVPFVCEDLHDPESGVEAALGPQMAINHAVILDAGTAEYAGFPLRWTATTPAEYKTGEVDFSRGFNLDDQFNDDDEDEDDQPVIDIFPGAFMRLEADAVGEFKAMGMEATLGRVEKYGQMAFILSEVPLSYWTGTAANNSGELMRREIQPLLGRAYRRITLYTASYKRVFELLRGQGRVLNRGNRIALPENISPVFKDPAWPDEMYIWELAGLQLDAGLPESFVYEKAGLSPDEIERINNDASRRRTDNGTDNGTDGGTSRGRRNRGDGANIS